MLLPIQSIGMIASSGLIPNYFRHNYILGKSSWYAQPTTKILIKMSPFIFSIDSNVLLTFFSVFFSKIVFKKFWKTLRTLLDLLYTWIHSGTAVFINFYTTFYWIIKNSPKSSPNIFSKNYEAFLIGCSLSCIYLLTHPKALSLSLTVS